MNVQKKLIAIEELEVADKEGQRNSQVTDKIRNGLFSKTEIHWMLLTFQLHRHIVQRVKR